MNLSADQLAALSLEHGALDAFVRYLGASGYSLASIAKLAGEPDTTNLLKNAASSALLYDYALRQDSSTLACLARLFLLGGRVRRDSFESIPLDFRTLLEKLGLVRAVDHNLVTSTVTIVEFESNYLFSDKLFEFTGDDIMINVAHDSVWPMAEWSLCLYRALAHSERWTTLLDVGCGSGCISILGARRYDQVYGIDLNPRAVTFSTLNARLAGLVSPAYRTADCLTFAQEAERKFDHIVFASPGGPNGGGSSMVSDGGRLGHELLLRFLAGPLDGLLTPHGCCQVWGIFAIEEHLGSIEKLLAHSLPRDRFLVSVMPLRQGGLYLSRGHIQTKTVPHGCHYGNPSQLLPWLRKNGVIEVVSAVVNLQRKP